MDSAEVKQISCRKCGNQLDPAWANVAPRPPCPQCGSAGVALQIGIATEVNVAGSIGIFIQPQQTVRDWRRRWKEVEAEWGRIEQGPQESLSGDAINAAHHRLQSFYVQAYHLKDALTGDANSGIAKGLVEAAITNDVRLALLADLANLDKHYRLAKPPRSGDTPTVVSVGGEARGDGAGRWHLRVNISHKGRTRDGTQVAREAMDAWRDHLIAWRLI